ncbi:MAG: class I SAM-dependent methyltransferase [Anaerolineales bacterium]|nr:class I SAM-dependent methyltransferase [Anaerolineales bacterium]MCX7609608.1 class I SAM-dependent methyltransferase [Anaerolineales bacterium]MDW8227849.1 class I SAM-dependent methyltransferase [Anaerolineales bacterium]
MQTLHLLTSPHWKDYELLDSGGGRKLERFGPYLFVRPEVQALWKPALPAARWNAAHAVFVPTGEESGGHWEFRQTIAETWEMTYPLQTRLSENKRIILRFSVMTTPGRHLGVFPECAANWEWAVEQLGRAQREGRRDLRVLNLFGYTGLATLACAAAGAQVTHVDASKKSVAWARENAARSGLADRPIRWIVDDALKFVQREGRRGVKYDGILLDPPKFGRGPKGEVWEVYQSLPHLLAACQQILSPQPLFVLLTVYAVKLSSLHAAEALKDALNSRPGTLECGELVTVETSAGRLLSQAVYARWQAR